MITQEKVKELFDYRDGHLWWKNKKSRNVNLNKSAGGQNGIGYIRIKINKKSYLEHRLIWLYHKGEWPEYIDHINHDRSDNRIENLRSVLKHDNERNQSKYTTNTSGYTGVSFRKSTNKWVSTICIIGKNVHLGYFDNIEDAIIARKEAELKYNFHPNHGA